MPKAPEPRVMLVATESFRGGLPDGSTFDAIRNVTRVWPDHPAAKRWPQFWTPVTPTHETPNRPAVEQATAAPGELRGE